MKKVFFVMLILLFPQVTFADNGEGRLCIERWNSHVDKIKEAAEKMESGFNILDTRPDGAFDFLNLAHSTADTYGDFGRIWANCHRYAQNLTEKEAEEMDKIARKIERRSYCGMKMTGAVKEYEGVRKNLKEVNRTITYYKEHPEVGTSLMGDAKITLKVAAEQNLSHFDTIIKFTSECKNESDVINAAVEYKNALENILSQLGVQ